MYAHKVCRAMCNCLTPDVVLACEAAVAVGAEEACMEVWEVCLSGDRCRIDICIRKSRCVGIKEGGMCCTSSAYMYA